MKKYVRILKMPECGYVVIGDRTMNYSVGDIVDVSVLKTIRKIF